MTPRKAAEIIGCSIGQVRTLVRNGRLRAVRVPCKNNQHGYRVSINAASVRRYADKPQALGFPRGAQRKKNLTLLKRSK